MSATTIRTTSLNVGSDTINLGKVGHGLMLMTWKPTPVPDEQCFDSIKASLDMVPSGAKMLINSGEFYGMNPKEANLELLARFFEKYPSYANKAFLSVKGGLSRTKLEPDSSPENLRASIDTILAKLRGTKKLDLFQSARVDPKVPVEDAIKTLSEIVAEGKIDFIGMSECKAETLRRGHAVHPIALVEIEVSPWSYDEPVKEVISTAAELGVGIAAYSPLGRGYLAGKFDTLDDLEDGDLRKRMARFQNETIAHNKAIADGVKALAAKRGITPAQLCLAWVCALGDHVIPIPGSSAKSRTEENTIAANFVLSQEELTEVRSLLETHGVQGARYYGNEHDALLMQ